MNINLNSRTRPEQAAFQDVRKIILKDVRILARFAKIYCDGLHRDRQRRPVEAGGPVGALVNGMGLHLCNDCRATFLHGAAKRMMCPYHPKPRCKTCPTPCYPSMYRDRMKAMMKYSGARVLLHGRLDLLYKYLF
jgi:hypothetical protein